jgi:hypothetical protein
MRFTVVPISIFMAVALLDMRNGYWREWFLASGKSIYFQGGGLDPAGVVIEGR